MVATTDVGNKEKNTRCGGPAVELLNNQIIAVTAATIASTTATGVARLTIPMRFPGQPFVAFVAMIAEANEVENRKKPKRCGGLTLFNHYFYFTSGLYPVAMVQAIEPPEPVELAIGNRHF